MGKRELFDDIDRDGTRLREPAGESVRRRSRDRARRRYPKASTPPST